MNAAVTTAYIGLGSNRGDRLGQLRAARDGLARDAGIVVGSSSVYETEPVGEEPDQPDFLNACVAVETELAPEQLLEVCKALERELGREPGGPRHGPRPIDVDLLLLDGIEHRSERLTLPHPEIARRRFVLAPLLEIDPELALPCGRRLDEALAAVTGQRAERVAEF